MCCFSFIVFNIIYYINLLKILLKISLQLPYKEYWYKLKTPWNKIPLTIKDKKKKENLLSFKKKNYQQKKKKKKKKKIKKKKKKKKKKKRASVILLMNVDIKSYKINKSKKKQYYKQKYK